MVKRSNSMNFAKIRCKFETSTVAIMKQYPSKQMETIQQNHILLSQGRFTESVRTEPHSMYLSRYTEMCLMCSIRTAARSFCTTPTSSSLHYSAAPGSGRHSPDRVLRVGVSPKLLVGRWGRGIVYFWHRSNMRSFHFIYLSPATMWQSASSLGQVAATTVRKASFFRKILVWIVFFVLCALRFGRKTTRPSSAVC